jgi:hypothetical protein
VPKVSDKVERDIELHEEHQLAQHQESLDDAEQRGFFIGQIQLFQELLEQPRTSQADLAAMSQDELDDVFGPLSRLYQRTKPKYTGVPLNLPPGPTSADEARERGRLLGQVFLCRQVLQRPELPEDEWDAWSLEDLAALLVLMRKQLLSDANGGE